MSTIFRATLTLAAALLLVGCGGGPDDDTVREMFLRVPMIFGWTHHARGEAPPLDTWYEDYNDWHYFIHIEAIERGETLDSAPVDAPAGHKIYPVRIKYLKKGYQATRKDESYSERHDSIDLFIFKDEYGHWQAAKKGT